MTIVNFMFWLTIGFFGIIVAILTYELLRWAGRAVARKRAQLIEPDDYRDEVTDEHFSQIAGLVDQDQFDNCGDQGGLPTAVELDQASRRPTAVEQQRRSRPKAPQIGSGLPARVRK